MHLNAVVEDLSRRAAGHPSVFVLARRSGLTLRPREREGALVRGDNLYYDATAELNEQRRMITEALAARELRAVRASKSDARYVARRLAALR